MVFYRVKKNWKCLFLIRTLKKCFNSIDEWMKTRQRENSFSWYYLSIHNIFSQPPWVLNEPFFLANGWGHFSSDTVSIQRWMHVTFESWISWTFVVTKCNKHHQQRVRIWGTVLYNNLLKKWVVVFTRVHIKQV